MSIPRRSLLTGLFAIPAVGAAGVLIGASPAAAAPASIDRTAFKLRRRAGSYATAIAGLDAALPNVSVQAVLDDGNRVATRIAGSEGTGLVTNFAAGFRFESGDDNTAE